ncbi:MAG: hypothetical protein ACRCZ2_01530 [Fusobacteriaceae bacterium]
MEPEIITRAQSAPDKYLAKSFEMEEAQKIADYFNSQRVGQYSEGAVKGNYKFKVMPLKANDIVSIDKMNKYAENKIMDTSGGFYIAALDDYNGYAEDKNYSYSTPTIFKNETGDLVFGKTKMSATGSFAEGTLVENRTSIQKFNKFDFVMANPFSEVPTITDLNGNVKISNQMIRMTSGGTQGLMNANYPDVIEHILDYASTNIYGARTYGNETSDMSYKMAATAAGKTISNPSGKTTTDFGALGQIKGLNGMNMSSTNSQTTAIYTLSRDMMEEFDPDFLLKLELQMSEAAKKSGKEPEKLDHFSITFENGGDAKKIIVNGNKQISLAGEEIKAQSRFHEYYNNVVSQVRQHSSPHSKSIDTMEKLNFIVDKYAEQQQKFSKMEVEDYMKAVENFDFDKYVSKMQEVILNSYDGKNLDVVNKMMADGGLLSKDKLQSFLNNGIKFHDYLDVNRQSINTEDIVAQTGGAIFDLFGVHNKFGQRYAQADAKMGKAVLNVGGETFDMTQIAKGWTSGVTEMTHKQINLKNTVAESLINKTQEVLYGQSLGSSYYSQQNFMIQTFHNSSFQDSGIVASDLAMENVSKYDYKKPITVPYGAINSSVFGEVDSAIDFSKLSSENALVDGTMENRIFRGLIGEDNYSRHLSAQNELIDAYKNVGRHMDGITNLQTPAAREAYALAQNEMIKETNDIFSKYFVTADKATARAELISSEAVSPGQARHMSGVNFSFIDGIEFGKDGVKINATGIINHGDSVKFMNDAIKSTTQSVELSLGIVSDNGVYLPTSGFSSEKITSGKRGFTGDMLQRSVTTMAFNHTTLGDSDDMIENFNNWKKAMENDYAIEGANGKQVNLFEAIGLDLSFDGKNMTFINKDTQEALGAYDFRAKGMTGSVAKKINSLIEARVQNLFNINLADNYGKDYTEILFGKMLAPADANLSNMITGSKNGLDEATRRALSKVHVDGYIEKIGVSKGVARTSNLGFGKGLRLLVNVHAMQETKSRADEEGVSVGRLSQQILRESNFFDLADDIEEETAFKSVKKAEKYYALTGATEGYEDIFDQTKRGYNLFGKDSINLKSPTLRYNIDGTNTTIEKFIKNSPLGEMIGKVFDTKTGELTETVSGHLAGFDDQFLDVVNRFTGGKGAALRGRAIGVYNYADIGKVLTDKKYNLVESQREEILKIIKEGVGGVKDTIIRGDASKNSINRLNVIGKIMNTLDDKQGSAFMTGLGLNRSASNVSATPAQFKKLLNGMANNLTEEGLLNSKYVWSIKDSALKSVGFETLKMLKSQDKNLNNFVNGERVFSDPNAFDIVGDVGNVEFDSEEKQAASRLFRNLVDTSKLDDYSSNEYGIKMFMDRLEDYSGKNVFNIKALNEISEKGVMRFMVDELSADEYGAIVSKSSLTNLERLIKQNADLGELNKLIANVSDSSAMQTEDKMVLDKAYKKLSGLLKDVKDDKGIDNKKFKEYQDKVIKKIDEMNYKEISRAEFNNVTTEGKMGILEALDMESVKYQTAMTDENIYKREELKKVKREMADNLVAALRNMGEDSQFVGNAQVSANTSLGKRAHGSIVEAMMEELKVLDGVTDDKTKFRTVSSMLKTINATIDSSKGSNISSAGLSNMVAEKDAIKNIINNVTKDFFASINFEGNANHKNPYIEYFSKFNEKVGEYGTGEGQIGKEKVLAIIDDIDNRFNKHGRRVSDTFEEGLASEVSRIYSKKLNLDRVSGDELKKLINKREKLKLDMIGTVKNIYGDMTDNAFRKGGIMSSLSTIRFKNSVEFSPSERSISANYIGDEIQKVMSARVNGIEVAQEQDDMFRALKIMYGNEIVDDIYSDYNKAINGASNVKDKELIVSEFRKGLTKKLDNLSGIVMGTRKDFQNAGLSDMLKYHDGKFSKGQSITAIMNGFLSRNPHQYIGSLRATRYVALDENDRNLSFLAGLFGDTAKIAGTQGHLALFGKRTAISAHGDHDGDKFQALFMTENDFRAKYKRYGKKHVEQMIDRRNSGLEMYRLLGDYNGNLRESIESGKLTSVEMGILKHGRAYKGMSGKETNEEVFEKIKHTYWTMRGEYRRTTAEVLDENISHADVPYYKLTSKLNEASKASKEDFAKVVSEMTDEGKLAVMANTFDYQDMKNIDNFFDPSMLEDKSFVERLNKIKKVTNDRFVAETLVKEFNDYGVDKIKWSNATLSDSSYAAYTGIARTGTVHYALTNIRDTASSMFSNVRTERMFKSINARGLDADTAKDMMKLVSQYKHHGEYLVGANTFGTLIEKLAVSAKLLSGINPYQAVRQYSEFTDQLALSSAIAMRGTNASKASELIKFDNLEKVFEYLSDNDSEKFDYAKFEELTDGKGFGFFGGGGGVSISDTLQEFALKDLFGEHFTRKALMENDWSTPEIEDMVKGAKNLTNGKVLQTLSNAYTMMGTAVMGTVSGAYDIFSDEELMKAKVNGMKVPKPYSDAKTSFFGKSKNLFYNMFKVSGSEMLNEGYNPEYGIFYQFKGLLKNLKVTTGGGDDPDGGPDVVKTPKPVTEKPVEVRTDGVIVHEKLGVEVEPEPTVKKASPIKRIVPQQTKFENEVGGQMKLIPNIEDDVIEALAPTPKVEAIAKASAESNVVKTNTIESIEEIEQQMAKSTGASHIKAAINNQKTEKAAKSSVVKKAQAESAEIIETYSEQSNVVKTNTFESIEEIEKQMAKNAGASHIKAAINEQNAEAKKSAKSAVVKKAKAESAEIVDNATNSSVVKTTAAETESILESTDTISKKGLEDAEIRINALNDEVMSLKEVVSQKQTEIDDVTSKIINLGTELDSTSTNATALEEELSTLKSQLQELNESKQSALKQMNEKSIAEQKAYGELKKSIYGMQDEHKKALNNIKANAQKAAEEKDKLIAQLNEKVKTLSSKITQQTGTVTELKEALKVSKSFKGGTSAVYNEFAQKVSKVGENAKKVYNNNSKVAIGAAASVVLGTVFSMLQGSRPIVDVDIRQQEYEKQNGSVYQNLGSYGINTNIRGIR